MSVSSVPIEAMFSTWLWTTDSKFHGTTTGYHGFCYSWQLGYSYHCHFHSVVHFYLVHVRQCLWIGLIFTPSFWICRSQVQILAVSLFRRVGLITLSKLFTRISSRQQRFSSFRLRVASLPVLHLTPAIAPSRHAACYLCSFVSSINCLFGTLLFVELLLFSPPCTQHASSEQWQATVQWLYNFAAFSLFES